MHQAFLDFRFFIFFSSSFLWIFSSFFAFKSALEAFGLTIFFAILFNLEIENSF